MTVAESDRHNACQESRGESAAPATVGRYMLLRILTKHGKDQTQQLGNPKAALLQVANSWLVATSTDTQLPIILVWI